MFRTGKAKSIVKKTQKDTPVSSLKTRIHISREAILSQLNTSETSARLCFVLAFTWRGLNCRRGERYVQNTI